MKKLTIVFSLVSGLLLGSCSENNITTKLADEAGLPVRFLTSINAVSLVKTREIKQISPNITLERTSWKSIDKFIKPSSRAINNLWEPGD